MQTLGVIIIVAGSMFIALGGAYFYTYFQNLAAAASTTSVSPTTALSLYNGSLGMPIIVTLSIFGLGMIIVGGFFVASAHITQQFIDNSHGPRVAATEPAAVGRPTKICMKCGTLLFQNTAYCPSCGNPITGPKTP